MKYRAAYPRLWKRMLHIFQPAYMIKMIMVNDNMLQFDTPPI